MDPAAEKVSCEGRVGFDVHVAVGFDSEAQAVRINPRAAEHPPDRHRVKNGSNSAFRLSAPMIRLAHRRHDGRIPTSTLRVTSTTIGFTTSCSPAKAQHAIDR